MRIEKDAIGTLDLKDTELYGVHTKRAFSNFAISNYQIHPEFIRAFAEIKSVCAVVNEKLGYLTKQQSEAIQFACQEIISGNHHDQIIVDAMQGGAGTSTNMNCNEVIANLALQYLQKPFGNYEFIHPLHHVNLHQSTNDVYPTALKIAVLRMLKKVENEISQLQEAFQNKEHEFSDVIKIGRTQLQDAVPMTLGMEFGAYAEAFARDRWRLFKSRERIKVINLGGTAIGTGLTAPRKFIFLVSHEIQKKTGLNIVRSENLVDTTQNQDVFVEVMGMVKAYATNLLKISSDLRLLASGPQSGLSEIILPAVQTGSSIMPGKVNPVILEAVSQVAIKVIANDSIVSQVSSMGQLELNQFLPLLAHSILESLEMLKNITKIFTEKCVKGIRANREKCEKNVLENNMIVTVLLPYFGYQKMESIVKKAQIENEKVFDLIIREKLLSEQDLTEIISPKRMYKLGFTENDVKKGK